MSALFALLLVAFLIASIVVDRWNHTAANVFGIIAIVLWFSFLGAVTMGM